MFRVSTLPAFVEEPEKKGQEEAKRNLLNKKVTTGKFSQRIIDRNEVTSQWLLFFSPTPLPLISCPFYLLLTAAKQLIDLGYY